MFLYRQNQKFFTNWNQTNKYIYEPNETGAVFAFGRTQKYQ